MAANLWCDPGGYATDGTITTIGLLVRPGDVFVDVGAHIGLHTITGSRASGPSGRVISLEPHPVTSRWLRENVQLNDLENVTVHAAAAGVANGRAAFSDRPLEDRNALEHDGSLLVEVVRLDDLLGDVDRVRLLKIDVEGSELDVLAGATAVLQRTDAVLVEAWSEHDVRSVLADFDTEVLSTGPGYVNLLAQRRAPGTQRP